jgi:hypothetical protein
MVWVHFSDAVNAAQVEWPHLNETVSLLIFMVILVSQSHISRTYRYLFVDVRSYQIENWNDFNGVLFYLPVQGLVVLEQVIAVDFKHGFFELS